MFRTIIWFFEFIFTLILTIPWLLISKYKKKKYGDKTASVYGDKTVRVWVKSKLALAGANVDIKGIENVPMDKKVVFISNHQSNFDIAVILNYIPGPKGFVAKKEMASVPLLKGWMEIIGCVFIDRKSPRSSIQAISQAIKNVKNGINMVVFPEGSRSKGGPVGDFKLGSFRIALKSKAVIVPITIDGTYKLMEEKNRVKPGDVSIVVHPPIDTTELSEAEADNINNTVRDIILSGF